MADLANPTHGRGIARHPRDQAAPRGTRSGSRPRVVVCSNTRLLREGITAVAEDGPMDIIGTVEPGDAPAMVAAQCPDALLLDAGAVDGRRLPRLLKEVSPDLRIV